MKNTLAISSLHASTTGGKEILHGISLTVKKGEIHAIMGPNGAGKSTLAQTLMGHPGFKITQGKIIINGVDISHLPPDQRAKNGLFLGFQYPIEVPGVNFDNFLRMAINENQKKGVKKISPLAFRQQLTDQAKRLAFSKNIIGMALNEDFSGGEKKKAEILQFALIKPEFAILDEPDSGLDVDALKYIAKTILSLDYPFGLILITHYQRILHYIKPDFVHIMINGKLVKSGDSSLAKEIEKKGYEGYLNNVSLREAPR
ncbi:Fe-S cluster assembly ATPase SufC [Patescibacteria group bacterium]|nr:Fe-S cluster assembly ATPase SufC [Patescibacteria group bacterium]MBU4098449.1 Fe-S cluster assembly ATPase SufC [Patescibacteria group bacterium]